MAKQVINIGQTANDKSGDPLRTAFAKVNANFEELYAGAGGGGGGTSVTEGTMPPTSPAAGDLWYDTVGGRMYVYYDLNWVDTNPELGGILNSLENGNKIVSLGTDGTLTVPSPTTNIFTLSLSPAHYVSTLGKPSLVLSGTPWVLHGEFQYAANGDCELMLDNIWPILNNPGYSSGDTFTFSSSIHGVEGYALTIQLNNVVLPGGAGWTANVAASQAPTYPTTVKSLGAIKFTAGTSNVVIGTDGSLTLPVGGTISYVPTTPSDWAGTAPLTIQDAIDRLATVVKALNNGTGA